MQYLVFFILVSLSGLGFANERDVQFVFSAESVFGTIKNNGEHDEALKSSYKSVDSIGMAVRGGIILESNILIELGYSSQSNWSFFGTFDDLSLSQKEVMLGYQFKLESISFVPRIGYSFWELSATEGTFLNSGEEESGNIEGENPFASIALQIPLNKKLDLGFAYKYMSPRFGSVKQFSAGVVYRPAF